MKKILLSFLLAGLTLVIYWQVSGHDFIKYDDPVYVTEEEHVMAGLSKQSLKWVWTSSVCANWHPLTVLSHMLDVQWFGANPGRHHLTSVFFHVTNTLLLFLVLSQMTGAVWRPAFAAALFAVHPLHVESVAWIAERKDVLSFFFAMLALWAYKKYSKRPCLKNYLMIILWYACGLMSKPMLVSFPLLLLLLDHWPLSRKFSKKYLIFEKAPFFLLAGFSCLITLDSQHDAMKSLEQFSIHVRIKNAVVSYVRYIGKTIWPAKLALVYPHPGADISRVLFLVSLILLISATGVSLYFFKKRSYIFTGWFWFLISLVPVIGLVQVGDQALADRYMYLPSVGLFFIMAWGIAEWIPSRSIAAGLAVVVILFFSGMAWRQTSYWKNTQTLLEHALAVTGDNNYLAHNVLGNALQKEGKIEEAIRHHQKAVELRPHHGAMHYNLAVVLKKGKRINEAIEHYTEAVKWAPEADSASFNLALTLAETGRIEEAVSYYLMAIETYPQAEDVYHNLGNLFLKQHELEKAKRCFHRLLWMHPHSSRGFADLASVYEAMNQYEQASRYYLKALDLDPHNEQAYQALAKILVSQKKYREAVVLFREKLKWSPKNAGIHYNLALVSEYLGNFKEAQEHYGEVMRLKPEDQEAQAGLKRVESHVISRP